jgi:hypothetical protein
VLARLFLQLQPLVVVPVEQMVALELEAVLAVERQLPQRLLAVEQELATKVLQVEVAPFHHRTTTVALLAAALAVSAAEQQLAGLLKAALECKLPLLAPQLFTLLAVQVVLVNLLA